MRDDTASEPSLLSTSGLTRAYRGGKGVFDISLKLSAGEIFGLMGPNGSGKTTLLRLLATAANPTASRISWIGSTDFRDPSVRRRLGIMLEQPVHCEQMTGYQNACLLARQSGMSEDFERERI